MPLWKRLLLTLYYHASYPVRMCNYRREAAKEHLPISVLFYHRIADDRATPWTLSNSLFMRQIAWLRERFEIVTLEEAQERIRRGYNARACVSITFDDGYADNCQQAIPWLVRERIPCTYFATLYNAISAEPFAHDLVMGKKLAPNTIEQLRAMAASGVEIGGHAYTHADLGAISDPRLLHYEIVTAKKELEAALDRPLRYFAVPFGHYANLSPAVFAVAQEAGYRGVCSAYGGLNFPGDDPFHIQRIPVDDDMIRLKNWVTLDPRKLRTRRYEYRAVENEAQGPEVRSQESRTWAKIKGGTKVVKRR